MQEVYYRTCQGEGVITLSDYASANEKTKALATEFFKEIHASPNLLEIIESNKEYRDIIIQMALTREHIPAKNYATTVTLGLPIMYEAIMKYDDSSLNPLNFNDLANNSKFLDQIILGEANNKVIVNSKGNIELEKISIAEDVGITHSVPGK